MRCPGCGREDWGPDTTCSQCGFTGPPDLVEELAHVHYLLRELETWREISPPARTRLRARYQRHREELEIALGLRAPPLTATEIRKRQWELVCLEELRDEVAFWLEQGWVRAGPAGRLRQGAGKRAEALRQSLAEANAPPPPRFDSIRERLKLLDYLEGMLDLAQRRGHFVDDSAYKAALADLQEDRRDLEIKAGLRPRPPELAAGAATAPEVVVVEEGVPPAKPREPLTWDRIWQTLLSERTLNVLLFLGAFLLVASATTYVVYNWEKLSPAIQLAFIVLFTLSFYGGGWFLRLRMGLRASGIAVTAVGSLLVPLDFYAVFIAGGVWPVEVWPWVWLMASAICLPIYAFTALRIRAEFFGYLVALAAGNLLCAVLQVTGVSNEWWLAALIGLALACLTLAYRLQASRSVWAILATPFRNLALVTTAVILPLGIGWWIAGGAAGTDFDTSLAVSWTLGAALFAYAAARQGSALLGGVAATVLPVALFLLLRLAFEPLGVEAPWYALGWAILAPAYLWVGYRLLTQASSPQVEERMQGQGESTTLAQVGGEEAETEVDAFGPPRKEQQATGPLAGRTEERRAHGRTATGWGLALMAIAAIWSAFDLWAAAATHGTLVIGVVLAIFLWQRPRALPVASLLAFSSATFGMAATHLEPAELCLGWVLLALLHVLAAIRLRTAPGYANRLFAGAVTTGAVALLPPLLFGHEALLTYALGNWLGLAAWLIWLDRTGEHPGLASALARLGPLRRSALHWAITLPLPFFVAMLYTRFRPPDGWLGLAVGALAWVCFALPQVGYTGSRRLDLRGWPLPWYVVGYGCSLAGPVLAFAFYHQPLLGVSVLLASVLYFASAWAFRADRWLIPAGLALPLGLLVLLDYGQVPWVQQSVVLALVVAIYLLGGAWLERWRGTPRDFVAPLYAVAHVVALVALCWGLAPAAEHFFRGSSWPDSARLWAAGGQLILGVAYGLFAWLYAQERWAHVAAWLGVMAGGLIATAYSQGRGSSAFKAALLAAVYVLAERALVSATLRRRWLPAERAWSLYRRALLVAGWVVSAGAVGLALFRNLVLLGGGQVREAWAIAGLLAVTTLYTLSAWLFRRRLFLWLAGVLIIGPWTLLTLWGWFLWSAPPPLPRYALSWAVLACLELLFGLALATPLPPGAPTPSSSPSAGDWLPTTPPPAEDPSTSPPLREGIGRGSFGFPLRVVANLLLPFALFWGVADPTTSSISWGLGLAFYLISTVADHRRGLAGWRVARFLYPTMALTPVWAIYLLNRFFPAAPYESYGLLLLALALPLLAVGRWLRRLDAHDALPLYLGAYGVAVVGTMLVAHQRPLFAAALTFDALLCVLSAWIFREPLWGYPAAALAPAAMLVALVQSPVPPERRGWWLIGLGAVYVCLAWLLRRLAGGRAARQGALLSAYATPPLVMAFVVVALGLPPSSLDDAGAFWGYLAAALVYVAVAVWLRQPLLLLASSALLAVPYGVALVWLELNPANYGLALFPGVVIALLLAHLLDWRLGRPGPIRPSWHPRSWRWGRLLDWWAAPCYTWGYVGALAAVALSGQQPTQLAVALSLASMVYLHATWRFRSRGCLLLAGVLAQGSVLAILDAVGWLAQPAWAALAFLPVTAVTAALGLAIEMRRREGSPLSATWWMGWSWPFYLLLFVDLVVGQAAALIQSEPGAMVTAAHALLLAFWGTVWAQPVLPFAATALGIVGLFQAMAWAGVDPADFPVGLALLGLVYGLPGYGIEFARRREPRLRIWRRPLEWAAMALSALALVWMAVAGLAVVELLARTFLGHAITPADYASQVRMVMWVLALTGLLYLAAAVTRRWWIVGYGAVALLLVAWALWWRFFLDMAGFQWYAVPAGLYLLGVGWLEWRQGHRALARWIDRVGMLVWLGTAWWQSLPGVKDTGWPYALLMGAEALLLVWWGSARRQKRFLYVGVVGVVVNAVAQSIEPLLSVNRWIVFGIVGILLVSLAVLVERRLEAIRDLSAELRERLEGWE